MKNGDTPNPISMKGEPGPVPAAAAAKKPFSNPYIALYPPASILGWPNGATTSGATDPTRHIAYSATPQFNAQAGIPVIQPFPSTFMGFGNRQLSTTDRRKTNRTPVACVVCHKAKSTCDRSRPCARCRRLGKSHLCKDRPHRKKGRPRKRLLSNAGDATATSTSKSVEAQPEKKTRPVSTAPVSQASSRQTPSSSFKLSDCYLGNNLPQFMANATKQSSQAKRMGSVNASSMLSKDTSVPPAVPTGETSETGGSRNKADPALTELQTKFAQMAHSVNQTLWEEIIGDMSAYIMDAKKCERKYADILNKIPQTTRIMNPQFCMYLTHMSYYLHPDQFIQLQKHMANSGVRIPNGRSDKIRKFDESLGNSIDCKAIAPIARLRWCLKHPRPHMEPRFSRIDNWPLATIKVHLFNTSDNHTYLLYMSVNEEFERIFGFRQAEMVLMSRRPYYYRLIHPKDWKKQLSLEMSTLLNHRTRFNALIRCVCKWKEEIVCLETFRFGLSEDQTLTHFTISFTPLPRYMFK